MRYNEDGTPTGYEDHEAIGGNLQVQILSKPRLMAVLNSYLQEVQAVENAAWDLFTQRFLSVSTGWTLDTWGRIVGEYPRGSDSEAVFKVRISVRILVNRSRGTIPDLYGIGKLAFGHTAFIIAADRKTVSIDVFAPTTSGVDRARIVGWYKKAKVAGDGFRLFRAADEHPLIVRSINNPIPTNGIDSKTGVVPDHGSIMGAI